MAYSGRIPFTDKERFSVLAKFALLHHDGDEFGAVATYARLVHGLTGFRCTFRNAAAAIEEADLAILVALDDWADSDTGSDTRLHLDLLPTADAS